MVSWTADEALVDLMRRYVVATNRLEILRSRPSTPDAELEATRIAQREAAQAFEEALLTRGWRIPTHDQSVVRAAGF